MPQYPSISNGLGKLTPGLWNRLMTMLAAFEGSNASINGLRNATKIDLRQNIVPGRFFFAEITGNEELETNRYKYEFDHVDPIDWATPTDGDFEARDTGWGAETTTDETIYAYNLMEVNNTSTQIGPGVPVGTSSPSGSLLSIKPISDGSIVIMWPAISNDGEQVFFFQAENAIDVSCT